MGSMGPEAEGVEMPPPHVVCVAYAAQGHVTPMLQLAKLLHARGFHVTKVNTEFGHRRLFNSRGSKALDGIPPSDENATQDVPALLHSTLITDLPQLLSLIRKLNDDSGVPPVTCLVVDGIMSFAYDAAKELGVPCAALWTASACGLAGYRHYPQLVELGISPFRDGTQLADDTCLDTVVQGVRGMCDGVRLRDFPSFTCTTDNNMMLRFFIHEVERLSLPDAIMINTFDDLEAPTLDALRETLPPMYTVGPLHLHARRAVAEHSNQWEDQGFLLEWLDGQAAGSVVYVNFGSLTVMSNEQLVEFAWGLADSGYPFLWNIRPNLVQGSDIVMLPRKFLPSVKGRVMLTTWCPQEAVLAHQAVGLFLTHSGWNSTLESISGGVPMLSWPFFAEQQTNCRYVRTEWGIGMEIGAKVRRAELAEMIKEAMAGDKGREMHRRAADWKEKAIRAGGSAETNLDIVVNQVLLRNRKIGGA